MVDKTIDLGLGTAFDITELEKGLNKAEKAVINSASEMYKTIEKNAQEQTAIIRKEETEKIAIIKSSLQEQIAIIKASPDLTAKERQDKIKTLREAAKAEIDIVKNTAGTAEDVIKNSAEANVKNIQKSTKDKLAALNNFSKKGIQALKDFAKGAAGSLTGFDQVLAAITSGPQVRGKLFVDAGKNIISTLKELDKAAIEFYKTQDTLNAILQSTGANAWTTASQLNQLATEQSNATGRSKDEIIQAQTALLGYTNITKDVFVDTTQAALDMATVMRTDMESAVETLGKALDVPSQGLTALTRQGFRFTEQQKEMIKELERSGRIVDAQRVILDQVQQTYSGASTAINPAVQAQIKMNNAIENFKIALGKGMADAVTKYRNAMAGVVTSATDFIERTLTLQEAQRTVNTISEVQAANIARVDAELERIGQTIIDGAVVTQEQTRETNERREMLQKLRQEYIAAAREEHKYTEANLIIQNESLRVARLQYNAMEDHTHNRARRLAQEISDTERLISEITTELELRRNMTAIQVENNALAEKNDEISKTAAQYRADNEAALKEQIAIIERRAIIEGKSLDDLDVKKQKLDAEIQAYENLLVAAKGVISAEDEQETFTRLQSTWAAYARQAELEKQTDEERKKRLQELIRLNSETQSELERIYKAAQDEVGRLKDLTKEQKFQNDLTVIHDQSLAARLGLSKKATEEAVRFEADYRLKQLEEQKDKDLKILDERENDQKKRLLEIRDTEIEAAGNSTYLKTEAEKKYNEEIEKLDADLILARQQLDDNYQEQKRQSELDTIIAIEQAHKEMWQRLNSTLQEYFNAASNIASSISSIWNSSIDQEQKRREDANNAMVQSDEDRAANQKKIEIEMAYERYKAELFTWSANVTMATANAAMAVSKTLADSGGSPAGIVMAVMAGIMGAMQVAAVIAARPKRPSFHTGGQVQGRSSQEVNATLLGKEVVLTNRQFQNVMKNQAELARMKSGGGGVSLNVNIENNAARDVSVRQQVTAEGLKIVVEKITQDSISSGRQDRALSIQQSNLMGGVFI